MNDHIRTVNILRFMADGDRDAKGRASSIDSIGHQTLALTPCWCKTRATALTITIPIK